MAPTPYKLHNATLRQMEPPPPEPKLRTWNHIPNLEPKNLRHLESHIEPKDRNLYNMEGQYHNSTSLPYGRYNLEPKHQIPNAKCHLEPAAVKNPKMPYGEFKESKKPSQKSDIGGGEYAIEEPISRTYQYRKVMKPMLERKRRARINRCLDELKELMVTALQSEGENVSKLEKADILELTVRHLHNLKRNQLLVLPPPNAAEVAAGNYAERFRAGFTQCAQEVTQFITAPSEVVDPVAGRKLLQHLGACVRQLECISGQQMERQSNLNVQAAKSEVREPMWRPW